MSSLPIGTVLEHPCPDCGAEMILRTSRHGLFYGCSRFPKCKAAHGAHPDGQPLGIPASKETEFDYIWKSGKKRRSGAYAWMQEAMGMTSEEAHIGRFTIEQCKLLIEKVGELMGPQMHIPFPEQGEAKEPELVRDVAYFDGACEPRNPGGHGGWGFVIKDSEHKVINEGYGYMKPRSTMSNNVAEYAAAGAAVKAYKESGRPGPLLMRGDSKLVVEQMKGNWQARQGHYIPVRHRLNRLVKECNFKIEWEWIPRKHNAEADALSVKALEEHGVRRRKRC